MQVNHLVMYPAPKAILSLAIPLSLGAVNTSNFDSILRILENDRMQIANV